MINCSKNACFYNKFTVNTDQSWEVRSSGFKRSQYIWWELVIIWKVIGWSVTTSIRYNFNIRTQVCSYFIFLCAFARSIITLINIKLQSILMNCMAWWWIETFLPQIYHLTKIILLGHDSLQNLNVYKYLNMKEHVFDCKLIITISAWWKK